MTRTITRVVNTRRAYLVNWRGESELHLSIAKPTAPPRVGDVIVFRTEPAAGRLQPEFAIKKKRVG